MRAFAALQRGETMNAIAAKNGVPHILPTNPNPKAFGAAGPLTIELSGLVGLPTILHLGAAEAPYLNWELPQDLWPKSRTDYQKRGVLKVTGPNGFVSDLPFIGTAMRPLGRLSMVEAFASQGVIARVHRYFIRHREQAEVLHRIKLKYPGKPDEDVNRIASEEVERLNIEHSVQRFRDIRSKLLEIGGEDYARRFQPIMAVAPTSGGMRHVQALLDAGCTRFDIDTMGVLPFALLFAKELFEAVKDLPDAFVISGSVSNPESVRAVAPYCHAIDLGIGNGKSCSTRPTLGIGVHQGYALAACAMVLREMGLLFRESGKGCIIIASGGNLEDHDRAFALALGADLVTFGSSTQLCIESGAETRERKVKSKKKRDKKNGKKRVVYEVQVVGMASQAVAGGFSLDGHEPLPEGDDYWVEVPGGPAARPTFAYRVRRLAKALGGTLSSMGTPVDKYCLEYLRQAPVFYFRAPGAELENGTPGSRIIKG